MRQRVRSGGAAASARAPANARLRPPAITTFATTSVIRSGGRRASFNSRVRSGGRAASSILVHRTGGLGRGVQKPVQSNVHCLGSDVQSGRPPAPRPLLEQLLARQRPYAKQIASIQRHVQRKHPEFFRRLGHL